MIEHTTDRLFWTLTSIIVGALLLTVGAKAFPHVTDGILTQFAMVQKKTGSIADPLPNTMLNTTGEYAETKDQVHTTNQDYYRSDNDWWRINLWKLSLKKGHKYHIYIKYLDAPNKNPQLTDSLCMDEVHQDINDMSTPYWIGTPYSTGKNTMEEVVDYVPDHDMTVVLGITGDRTPKHYTNFKITDENFNQTNTTDTTPYAKNLGFGLRYDNQNNAIITSYDTSFGRDVNIPPYVLDDGGNKHKIVSVDDSVFRGKGLNSLKLPDTLTSLGYFAFGANNIKSINIPTSLTSIRESAFAWNKLTSVDIPNNIQHIDAFAFQGNWDLSHVTFGDNTQFIGKYAFQHTNLNQVSVPKNTQIEDFAFENNTTINKT